MEQSLLFETRTNPPPVVEPPPVHHPTAAQKQADVERIIATLRSVGEGGVSSLLFREMMPLSATQRISDAKKLLEKNGETIHGEQFGRCFLYWIRKV